jgi:uncharacterized protein (DUF1800 family)
VRPRVYGLDTGGDLNSFIYNPIPFSFRYDEANHDQDEKSFVGHQGRFDGEDVIDIIVQQPACHFFIARHLYNFFVADEPQVPAWPIELPGDPEAVRFIAETLVASDLEIRPVLRGIFNSDFFKEAVYKTIKSPAEVVAGTLKFTGALTEPSPEWFDHGKKATLFGQDLLDPPTVEGWHTGHEWVNSGALVGRVNYVADQVQRPNSPGMQDIVRRIASSNGVVMAAEQLVDHCLDLMGPLKVGESTKAELMQHVEDDGPVSWKTTEDYENSSRRVGSLVALIAGTREYQFG